MLHDISYMYVFCCTLRVSYRTRG